MVVSKYPSTSGAATINLANFAHRGAAQVWQLTAANTITRLQDIALGGNSFGFTLPPQSVTLFVVPASSNVPSPPTAPTNLRIR